MRTLPCTLPIAAHDWRSLADAVIEQITDLWHRQAAEHRPLHIELRIGATLGARLEAAPDDPQQERLCRWLDERQIRYRVLWGHVPENRLQVTWGNPENLSPQ